MYRNIWIILTFRSEYYYLTKTIHWTRKMSTQHKTKSESILTWLTWLFIKKQLKGGVVAFCFVSEAYLSYTQWHPIYRTRLPTARPTTLIFIRITSGTNQFTASTLNFSNFKPLQRKTAKNRTFKLYVTDRQTFRFTARKMSKKKKITSVKNKIRSKSPRATSKNKHLKIHRTCRELSVDSGGYGCVS